MSKYNSFLTFFIISVIALIVFLVFYIQAIFGLVFTLNGNDEPNPLGILTTILSPQVIITAIVLALANLVYRVLGIVYVARNNTVRDGEKAIWIIGFIIFGFITGIVFLVLAKGRKFVD
ncbi:MAG: hypothetical protein IPH68_10970 [Chitinophagaceae bacterium]|nr:hypothetical protein [Chitinophagaceae bacterium]MBK9530548.1 hypothetical protein [Chitinophagaceae bacterium]HQW93535.1 hypothetical protein [Ferruginibacter sp.]